MILPADKPRAVNSLAFIKYCVFAPPHAPGKKDEPAEELVEAPAPRTTSPGLVKLKLKLELLPTQMFDDVAVAVAVTPKDAAVIIVKLLGVVGGFEAAGGDVVNPEAPEDGEEPIFGVLALS